MRLHRWAAVPMVLAVVLSACGGSTASPSEQAQASQDGGASGEVVIAALSLTGQGQDLMFTQVADHKFWWDEVFDYAIEQDESGALVPGFAESWTVSDDQLSWTFVIRDGVKFHNGDTMTAEDVAWSWNRLTFDPESQHFNAEALAPLIESITADGNEVIVKTKEPQSIVPLWWAKTDQTMAGIVYSKAYFESVGAEEAFRSPIGTGPYKVVSITGEESAHLTAFTDDDRSDWQKSRTPGFADIQILALPDATTRLAELQTGGVDLALLNYSAIPDVEAQDDLRIHEVAFTNYSGGWCIGLGLNPDSPCNDGRVREAISIAIDREAIASSLYSDLASPSAGFYIGPGAFGYPDDLEAAPYDPDRARTLLEEAGYGDDSPLILQLLTYDDDQDFPSLPTLAEAIVAYLVDVGVDATIELVDWDFANEQLIQGQHPGQLQNPEVSPLTLLVRGFDNRFYLVANQISAYHNGRVGAGVEPGEGGLFNANQDLPGQRDRLEALAVEFDLDTQEALIGEYLHWMHDEHNQVPLLASSAIFGLSADVAEWRPIQGKPYPNSFWTLQPAD